MSADNGWDMRCPQCASTGPFRVAATSVFVIDAEGTEEHGDVEYDGGNYCECDACDHSGIVHDFRTA